MIIAIATSKGGAGKSTTAAALAGAAAARGLQVHIVDLDANHTVSRWLNGPSLLAKGITVSAPEQSLLTEHLEALSRHRPTDITLLDIAGNYERALTIAVARAHITLIPAATTEADIFEATRVANHVTNVYANFGRKPLIRLLLTRVQPLVTHAQTHAYKEIARLRLPLMRAMFIHRAAYEEIGLSGLPPHFADGSRQTVAKAIAEIDDAFDELIEAVVGSEAVPTAGAAA